MVRPKRLYINSKGKYYYIVDGKKKFIKVPDGMSQKQVQTINIKNIIGETGRRIRRKKKPRRVRYTKKVSNDMQESAGLPTYIFQPKKKILSLSEITAGATDTTDSKIINLLEKALLINKPAEKIGAPPIVKVGKFLDESPVQRNLFSSALSPISEAKDDDDEIVIPTQQTEQPKQKKTYRNYISTQIAKFRQRFGRQPTAQEMKDELLSQGRVVETPKIESAIKSNRRDRPDVYTPDGDEKQSGKGDDGLYNDEIEKIMKKRLRGLTVPVVAADEVDTLPNHLYNKDFFAAVINTDPSDSGGRHWRCIVIDNRDDFPSAEYFDSLAETFKPEPALLNVMRKICRLMNPEKYMKYKFSKIRRQSYNKSNCGYHVMKFIEDRYNGIPFEEASGYKDYMKGRGSAPDDSQDGEGDLASYEKKIKSQFKEYL